MSYRETLPEGCPPVEAEAITSPRTVFRLVRTNPPTDDDFRSQRAERPKSHFNVDECRARGVSVYADSADIRDKVRLKKFKGCQVCRVHLVSGAGRIQQTGAGSHHTWWPFAEFDILGHCQMEAS